MFTTKCRSQACYSLLLATSITGLTLSLSKQGIKLCGLFSLLRCARCDAEVCIYRISACSTPLVLRCTACTGKLMPAFRRLRPSLPPESCPIRPYARRLSTLPPMLPRDLSTHLDRRRGRRRFGGRKVEAKEGPIHLKSGCLVFVPPTPPHR